MTTNQDQTIYVTENKQEFVPEVGQYCIGTSEGGVDFSCQILAVVIDGDEKVIVFRYEEGDLEAATESNRYSFRPLKTEAEIRREKAVEEMLSLDPFDQEKELGMLSRKEFCEQLYDAGYIKPRVLTDKDFEEAVAGYSILSESLFKVGAYWAEKHIKGEA